MPTVTIYMPNHNYASYIEEAIESVLNQTFKEWELIIIDDGSTDNSKDKIDKYLNHPKVRVVYQAKKGLNYTNNIAMRLANGKYITRLDADDYLDENYLLVLVDFLNKNPEFDLVYPDFFHIDKYGNIQEIYKKNKITNESNEILDLPAHGACTMFRTEILRNIGPYNDSVSCQDGYDIWIKFIQKHRPCNVSTPLFYYRQHPSSLSKDQSKINNARRKILQDFLTKSIKKEKSKTLIVIPILGSESFIQKRPFEKLNGIPLINYSINCALGVRANSDIIDN